MRKIWCIVFSVTMALTGYVWGDELSATTQDQPKKQKKCLFPKSKKRAPFWVCNPHAEGLTQVAVGSAAKSKAGDAFMEQMAVANARKHLAQDLHDAKQPKVDDSSATESGTVTANESLENTKIITRVYGPNGALYVLVGVDETTAQ